MNPRSLYNLGYRFFRMPWELGPRDELIELVRDGRLGTGRAIDLGCGTGANAIFLAQHGFDVTGVDFAPAALVKARAAAAAAGVDVRFVEDDLTALRHDTVRPRAAAPSLRGGVVSEGEPMSQLGTFDLLVDYGTLDDLSAPRRDRYLDNVLPLAAPDARFLLWCFEWRPRRLDRLTGFMPMAPGEVERRFRAEFAVERVAGTEEPNRSGFIPGNAAYLMTRLPVGAH